MSGFWSEAKTQKSRLRAMHVARASELYHLRNDEGHYLHLSGSGVTMKRAYAWVGSAPQLKRLCAKGDYSAFKPVVSE